MKSIFTLLLIAIATFIKPSAVRAQAANVNDSLALVALFDSANGQSWTTHTGWFFGPLKTWYGITLNSDGRVTRVVLQFNNLKGSIPAVLGTLSSLQVLNLQYNQLAGSIPDSLGNLANLQQLWLNHNDLTGNIPASMGNLKSLQYLDLSSNKLTGPIPSSFGDLTSLTQFFCPYNQLTGPIPSSMGNLTKLLQLVMYNNQLSDTIPASLGNLINLQSLGLSFNQLSGNIPSSIGNLTNLAAMPLNNNKLSGNIPASISNLTKLTALSLNNNRLSGSIPSSIGNLVGLGELYLQDNQLSGRIPSTFGNLTLLRYFYLSNNQLADTIPFVSLDNLNLFEFHIDSNFFTFNGMEQVVEKYSTIVYAPQHNILLHFGGANQLSVSAGGALSNNTYKWYKGDTLVATITADSVYKPITAGNYHVAVTNAIAKKLTLYSDTFAVTSQILPVTFMQFTAQAAHNGNLLQWQTATEINSANFNIQRSESGTDFINIGEVNAAGNSSGIKNYEYTDMLAGLSTAPPVLYYRLQEVDKDGNKAYSKIIEINTFGDATNAILIYPNPVHDELTVLPKNISGKTTFALISTTGKVLQTQDAMVEAGQSITLSTSILAPGVYFVQIKNNGQILSQKFVKY